MRPWQRFAVSGAVLMVFSALAIGLRALTTPVWVPPTIAADAAVAEVNGEPITWAQVAERLDAAEVMGLPPAADPETWRVRVRQVVDSLVDDLLARQWAVEQGVDVTEAMIDREIAGIEARYGGPDALRSAMTEMRVTMDELRETQRRGLYLQAVIDRVVPVSDDDVDTYLTQPGTAGLSREDAAARIRAERAEQFVQPFLAERRQASEIQIIDVERLG